MKVLALVAFVALAPLPAQAVCLSDYGCQQTGPGRIDLRDGIDHRYEAQQRQIEAQRAEQARQRAEMERRDAERRYNDRSRTGFDFGRSY